MNHLYYGDELEAMTRREPKDADQLGLGEGSELSAPSRPQPHRRGRPTCGMMTHRVMVACGK